MPEWDSSHEETAKIGHPVRIVAARREALRLLREHRRPHVGRLGVARERERHAAVGANRCHKRLREPGDTHDHKARYRIVPVKATE